MDANSDVWQHALDWVWAALVGAFVTVAGAIIRLWRHEERLKALEAQHVEKVTVLSNLSTQIDANHEALTDRLAAAVEDIRADLRVLTTRCLTINRKVE